MQAELRGEKIDPQGQYASHEETVKIEIED